MKHIPVLFLVMVFQAASFCTSAQKLGLSTSVGAAKEKKLFIDVHHLQPGKIAFKDVADAHSKDLAVENKFGVEFLKFWVDENKGWVYCLSSAPDSASIIHTHREAHGLLPAEVYQVAAGDPSPPKGKSDYYLDIHELGEGNVSERDVAEAHKKDLQTQMKYQVNFINYWVDEKRGVVICLSQARDAESIIQTHKEAHGLLPENVFRVQQGQ